MSGGLGVRGGSAKEEHVKIGFHTKGKKQMDVGEQLLTHLRAFPTAVSICWRGLVSAISFFQDGRDCWTRCATNTILISDISGVQIAGDLPKLATLIAEELQKKWWTEPRYEESRTKFSGDAINNESAFKIETAIFISKNGFLTNDEGLLEELDALKNIVADGIITTNWDGLLEHLFPSYVVYVGQEGLIFSNVQGIGEIYKIHGTAKLPGFACSNWKRLCGISREKPIPRIEAYYFFCRKPSRFFWATHLPTKIFWKWVHSSLIASREIKFRSWQIGLFLCSGMKAAKRNAWSARYWATREEVCLFFR